MDQDKIRAALADRVLNVVSERTGVSTGTLLNIKHGKRKANAATLKVLADYLGVEDGGTGK